MIRNISMVAIGWLFAVGLGLSGMTDVTKVTGFLNLRGDWDPSLMGVMGGGIGVYAIGLILVKKFRKQPLFGGKFQIPSRRDITPRLILGASIFGAGWGLSGICPGPGIVSLVTGAQTSVVFIASMFISMFIFQRAYHWYFTSRHYTAEA